MNSVRQLILICMLTAAPSGSSLAESGEAPARGVPAAEEAQRDADDTKHPQGDDAPSSEVFVPTEDISEDFAVSFPVDI